MDTKTKWIVFGCGGALAVVLLIVVVLVGVGWWGFSAVKGMSDETAKKLLGEKLPEGYMVMGIPMPSKEGGDTSMVLLVNNNQKNVLVAVSTDKGMDPALMASSPEALSHFMQAASSQGGGSSSNVKKILETLPMTLDLTTQKDYPAVAMKAENEKGVVFPMVITMLKHTGNHGVVLINMDPNASGTNPNADFRQKYLDLGNEMERLINQTALSQSLERPGTGMDMDDEDEESSMMPRRILEPAA